MTEQERLVCTAEQGESASQFLSILLFLTWRRVMPDFSSLTERQREIYDFIRNKIEGRGYGPTVREIGLGFDIKSPNGVMCHLKALEKKGLIIREGFSARAIQLVNHKRPGAELPLLGLVAAGTPMAAIENAERLEFQDLF